MGKIPFTVYDFFACLFPGSVIVATVDYLWGYKWVLQEQHSALLLAFLVFLAYVAGHVVAHVSAVVVEEILVDKVLIQPSRTLMGEPAPRILGRLFPGYYKALPKNSQERVKEQARARGFTGTGESLFLHAYSIVTRDERAQRRLDGFRNLYGFARNMALAFIAAAILLAVGTGVGARPPSFGWAFLATGLSIAMLYRYLKFFRQFSYQLFITYAEEPVVGEDE